MIGRYIILAIIWAMVIGAGVTVPSLFALHTMGGFLFGCCFAVFSLWGAIIAAGITWSMVINKEPPVQRSCNDEPSEHGAKPCCGDTNNETHGRDQLR